MKRRHQLPSAILAAALLALHYPLAAQDGVLKPFRPGGAPPAEKPPAEEPPKAIPLKPFKPAEEPPKARPVPPKNPDPAPDAEIPKAKPVPKPAPAEENPDSQPPARPPKPATAPQSDTPEPGDIVVRPGVAPTSADQVQLQLADGYYSRKLWRDAVPEYERYLQQFPRVAPDDRQAAFYRLAECYRQTGSLNSAKANYESVLANFAGGEFLGYAAYRLGTILYEEKDYRAALPAYRRASVRLTQPTLIFASKFFTARCLEAIGQKTEAKVAYEDLAKVSENNPYRDASRLSAGRLLAEGKRRTDALACLLPLAKETTNAQIKADALARCAQLQFDLDQFDAALESVNAALQLPESAPWKEDLKLLSYRSLYGKKDYAGVIAKHADGSAAALTIENRLNALVIVADSHMALAQKDAAMAIYDQIIKEFPASPQARDASYARLRMLYENGDQRLLDEVNRFLTENPTAPQVERVSLMKAEALFKAADYQNAVPIYEVIVQKSKGLSGDYRGEAQFKLGWCQMQLRFLKPAIESFGEFIKDNPTHAKLPTAYAQRGSAFMQLKEYNAAQKDFEFLTTKFPSSKEREFGLENLALIHGQLGSPARMAETFEILLRDFPDSAAKAKANYWIGTEAFDRKDYKKAAAPLDAARKLDKEQFFERASLKLLASYYGVGNLDATQKEIEYYKANGGKAVTPADVIRWLGQKSFENADFENAAKYLPELVIRKEAGPGDHLLLGRARVRLEKFTDAVDSFNAYLAVVNDPVARIAGLIEKSDAQLKMKDWNAAEATIKEGLSAVTEGKYNGELRLRGAEVEAGRGSVEKAIQIFESIPVTLEDDDINPRALDRAIELHRQLGNEDKVKSLTNLLRSRYPEYLQKKKRPQSAAR